ncbi:thioredoxin domain-containing protein [Sphingomonas sp. KC8]|uniref:thioredoxin domain-containing protein n=1 Tax=Sphingomonas sp. KC8 TaxID=1030157 RepID=UPI00024893EB|nr:thioredoxin domain-containing protein [Sphingomonas sp. KC8]ARS29313.1 protein-disulfide isomerase-like protein [Sphingomonas sp. KC8]
MKIDYRWAVAALALAVAGCGKQDATDTGAASNAASPATPAPDGKDWTETVVATPEGGFRMGNPDAPVKLVEYASLTCPHCADFSINGAPKLRDEYVRTGKVSWEFRTFVLNPVDVAVSLLASCQGEGPFFKLVEQTYAEQKNWGAQVSKIPNAEITRIQGLPENQQFGALATAAGMDQFYRARGLSKDKADQCLSDKANLDRLIAIRDRGANQDKITGTPSFLINGKLAEGAFDWNSLSAQLKTAVGS